MPFVAVLGLVAGRRRAGLAALSAVVVTVPHRFRPTRAHARQCWNVRQLAPCYIFVGRWAVLAHVADGMGVLKQSDNLRGSQNFVSEMARAVQVEVAPGGDGHPRSGRQSCSGPGEASSKAADRRETIVRCGWDCTRWASGPAPTGR